MLPLTLLHLLLTTVVSAIGITPEILQPTTPVGPHQKAVSQYTTHVQQVGVFQMVVVMVYGQRQDLVAQHTTVQIGECLSASHHLPQLGILLRVIAAAAMAVSTVSVTSATIGLPPLAASMRTLCISATMATSICLAATIARTASRSVVSKNQNKS